MMCLAGGWVSGTDSGLVTLVNTLAVCPRQSGWEERDEILLPAPLDRKDTKICPSLMSTIRFRIGETVSPARGVRNRRMTSCCITWYAKLGWRLVSLEGSSVAPTLDNGIGTVMVDGRYGGG